MIPVRYRPWEDNEITSMKRIICLIDSLVAGGAQRQLVGLASLLKNKGYRVKVVTYYDYPFYLPFLQDNNVEYECLSCGRNVLKRLLSPS